jgi:hypothetical protein
VSNKVQAVDRDEGSALRRQWLPDGLCRRSLAVFEKKGSPAYKYGTDYTTLD